MLLHVDDLLCTNIKSREAWSSSKHVELDICTCKNKTAAWVRALHGPISASFEQEDLTMLLSTAMGVNRKRNRG